jgi:hypothetical protein
MIDHLTTEPADLTSVQYCIYKGMPNMHVDVDNQYIIIPAFRWELLTTASFNIQQAQFLIVG